ncbi:MAG: ABC transporter ATP-binding protein [Acidimicrobiales bacterium]
MATWTGGRSKSEVPVPGLQAARREGATTVGAGLEVAQLTVRFGGLLALDEVSLQVAPEEVVGLIGPNGAGKTTLFNAVSGFVRPTRGSIRWKGRRLRNHHPDDLGHLGIARTLQGVGLCQGLTAVENVALGAQPSLHSDFGSALGGLWRSSREERRVAGEATALLDELGVADWGHRLPGSLPYGVQKRVALARALLSRPQLLLLDEPASGLSEDDIDDLCSRIQGLRERMSVLLVEHRMDFVMAACDRIVVLNFGEVIATGTPAEVQASSEVTAAYLGDAVNAAAPRPAEGAVDAAG